MIVSISSESDPSSGLFVNGQTDLDSYLGRNLVNFPCDSRDQWQLTRSSMQLPLRQQLFHSDRNDLQGCTPPTGMDSGNSPRSTIP